jgi:hypothetical protein
MIISIIAILLIGFIAYWHTVQGAFSGVLSAALAMTAAVVAVGVGPYFAALFQQGGFAPYADAVCMCVLFALIYFIGRVIFDKVVPGSVRINNTIDKVIGGLCGLVAGAMSLGVLGVAAESMPFGTGYAMHARYATETKNVTVRDTRRRRQDLSVGPILEKEQIEPGGGGGMWLPADDLVMALTAHVSNGGSLAGPLTRRMDTVAPDPLDGLYGQRLGLPAGAKTHLLIGTGGQDLARVIDLGVSEQPVPQTWGETNDLIDELNRPDDDTYEPPADSVLLVARVQIDADAADSDDKFRFGLANARLILDGTTHFPIGTLEGGAILVVNAHDDPLALNFRGVNGPLAVDLAFEVKRSSLGTLTKLPRDATLIFKRYGEMPLSDAPLAQTLPPASPSVSVMRKTDTIERIATLATGRRPTSTNGEEPEPEPEDEPDPENGGRRMGGLLPPAGDIEQR